MPDCAYHRGVPPDLFTQLQTVCDNAANEGDLAAGRHHLYFLAPACRGGVRRRLSHLTCAGHEHAQWDCHGRGRVLTARYSQMRRRAGCTCRNRSFAALCCSRRHRATGRARALLPRDQRRARRCAPARTPQRSTGDSAPRSGARPEMMARRARRHRAPYLQLVAGDVRYRTGTRPLVDFSGHKAPVRVHSGAEQRVDAARPRADVDAARAAAVTPAQRHEVLHPVDVVQLLRDGRAQAVQRQVPREAKVRVEQGLRARTERARLSPTTAGARERGSRSTGGPWADSPWSARCTRRVPSS